MSGWYWAAICVGVFFFAFWLGAAYGFYRPWEDGLDRIGEEREL